MKKVSVIIPTYRRPKYLSRAIKSVVDSGYENVEIIVVDDNNAGDQYRVETETLMNEILKQYPSVKYIKHAVNKNGSAARNTGIKNSSGEYIMFLDDDDEFLPGKIQKQVERMESLDNSWAACYTRYIDVMNSGKTRNSAETAEGNLLINELARNLFVHAGSNLMVRRSVVEEIGGFDESFTRNQDIEFLIKILKRYKLAFVDCVGLKVYLHDRGNIDYDDLTEKFVNTFSKEIGEQSERDQKAIYKMLSLQRIRASVSKRDFRNAYMIKKDTNISTYRVMHYFAHLVLRKISNQARSYPMKYLY